MDGAIQLRLVVIDAGRPEYFDDSFFTFNATVISGTTNREIVNWHITPTGVTEGTVIRPLLIDEYQSNRFEVMGDEVLVITVTVHPERGRYDPLTDRHVFTSADLMESVDPGIAISTGCSSMYRAEVAALMGIRAWNDRGYWALNYSLCRLPED